jgi:hypothetical protein
MLSKSNKNLRRRISESLDLQIHHNKSMEKVTLTCREKERERITNLNKTSPSLKKRREIGRQRRTLESGVTSTKFPSKTLMNVAQIGHWWLS